MTWLYVAALVVLGAIVIVLIGRWEGAAGPVEESPSAAADDVDQLLEGLGSQGLTAGHLEEVRFDSAVRGYRMDQVDKLLAALAAQLRTAADEDDIRPR